MNKEFDAFISHSSNDKEYFVRPLANVLKDYGSHIWYDEFSLKPGMSLSRSIEKGLSNSRYGIVVLSETFFSKSWTEYELRALNSFEVKEPGVIIPIWYKVNEDQVRNFSPYLADKLAIVYSSHSSIDSVAIEVLEVIREDIFTKVHRRKKLIDIYRNSDKHEIKTINPKDLKMGPVRHESLPMGLITRIRLIRSAVFEVYPHSMEYWLDGFLRDLNPEDEIHVWERISSAYIESINALEIEDKKIRNEVLGKIISISTGVKLEELKDGKISGDQLEEVYLIYSIPLPPFDIDDRKFGDFKES